MPRVIGFHYTVRDEDGDVLDSSSGGDPLFFLEGRSQIIPGLERRLAHLATGDRRTLTVPAAEAYGDVDPDLIARVERGQFPPGASLEVGETFTVDAADDAPVFTIVEVEDDTVTVDGNHPLAGRDLTFEVEIVGMREALPEELAHGHAHGPEGHEH